eukprot:TRINITY_DN66550_c0_g1_i1.p2 TRINITY_DN66550_c0_g1~~TRINITY_DN66550_c0_g1_i1.p2  ORF type:complete len:447 (+),score=116.74 TRINITY_DN66550_c0_g1_i1:73-1341(+)
MRGPAPPIAPFALERYFAVYEFTTEHLLCCSDTESVTVAELLAGASEDLKREWEQQGLGYTHTLGSPELRRAVAAAQYPGCGLGEEDIHVGAPQELIYLYMRCVLRPGDRVVCLFPGYQSLYEIAKSIGCAVDYWPVRYSEGGGEPWAVAADGSYAPPAESAAGPAPGCWRADVNELRRIFAQGPPPRLLVANLPHNPTGATLTPAELREVYGLCRDAGTLFLCDEMYRLLEPEGAEPLPAAGSLGELATSISGMSKSVGMPGTRIGWLATRNAELLAAVAGFKDYVSICPPGPSEIAARMALQPGALQRLLGERRALVAANLALAAEFLTDPQWGGAFVAAPPAAGPICFPRVRTELFRRPEDRAGGVRGFCDSAATRGGVMLLPSTVYGIGDTGHFRLGLGRRNFPAGLAALRRWVAALL